MILLSPIATVFMYSLFLPIQSKWPMGPIEGGQVIYNQLPVRCDIRVMLLQFMFLTVSYIIGLHACYIMLLCSLSPCYHMTCIMEEQSICIHLQI